MTEKIEYTVNEDVNRRENKVSEEEEGRFHVKWDQIAQEMRN